MMALGAGLAEGFTDGFRTMTNARIANEEMELRQSQDKRAAEKYQREKEREDEIRSLGQEVADMNASFFGAQQQKGVAAPQQMGPPGPDGTMADGQPPQPDQPAPAPMSRLDADKISQDHMAKLAPKLARLAILSDPLKGIELATKLSQLPAQQYIAKQVAIGTLLLNNPNSEDGRQAAMEAYSQMPHTQGTKMDPASYRVLDNGTIQFDVVGADGQRSTQAIPRAQIKAMAMQGLTPAQLAEELRHAETLDETKRYHGVQEKNLERDDARAEKEFGLRMKGYEEDRALRRETMQGAREDRAAAREDRKEQKSRAERDDIMRGIDNVLIGDPKVFTDRTPEEKQQALGLRGDTVNIIDMNPDAFKGKGSSVGARALSAVNAIGSGKAELRADLKDPTVVWAKVGGNVYRLPRDSYVVQSILQQKGTK